MPLSQKPTWALAAWAKRPWAKVAATTVGCLKPSIAPEKFEP